MERIISAKPLKDYRIDILFDDGTKGIISIKDRLFGPVFEPIKDPDFFSQLSVDEFGVICWPNGADIAPDAIYQKLKSGSSPGKKKRNA